MLAKADAKKLQKPVAMTATAPSAEAEARARAAEAELLAMLDLEGPGAGGASGSEQGKAKSSEGQGEPPVNGHCGLAVALGNWNPVPARQRPLMVAPGPCRIHLACSL